MTNDLLSRHHAELDQRVAALQTTADGGDGPALALAWGGFERELLRHFELEERELFARFALERPDEVAALKQDHEALRRDLLALGIRADLHCLRAEAVRGFVADLRAHAEREEQALYRWAATGVGTEAWSRIARGLREARETTGRKLADGLSRLGARSL
jgi:hypothetical protein